MTAKTPLRGLIDRKAFPQAGFETTLDGFVCEVNWSDLQASSGAALTTTAIDAARAQCSGYPNLRIKLRVLCGINAPSFAKTVGGFTPIGLLDTAVNTVTVTGTTATPTIYSAGTTYANLDIVFSQTTGLFHKSKQSSNTGNAVSNGTWWTSGTTNTEGGLVGPFWQANYQALYLDLMNKLSTLYDGDALIADVACSGSMTIFAEPCVRHTKLSSAIDIANANLLIANGYTQALDMTQQLANVAAMGGSNWANTPVSYAFSRFEVTQSGAGGGFDDVATSRIMTHLAHVKGDLAIPGNNSVASTTNIAPTSTPLYSQLGAFQQSYVQTRSPSSVVDLPGAVRLAHRIGAVYVELPLNTGSAQSYDSYLPSDMAALRPLFTGRAVTRSRVPGVPPPFITGLT